MKIDAIYSDFTSTKKRKILSFNIQLLCANQRNCQKLLIGVFFIDCLIMVTEFFLDFTSTKKRKIKPTLLCANQRNNKNY